jgi:hypothetical protein
MVQWGVSVGLRVARGAPAALDVHSSRRIVMLPSCVSEC